WILHTAVSTAAGWRADGWPQATVAINVSAPQFFESDFVDHVARTLEASGLPASALELEITETVFQTGAATIDSLRQLRALGVTIALDDFGIGYSSLTSLEQLPISRVKLDRLLVAGVDTNARSAAILRSIVALCHGLGLQVVAEGVERAAQLEFLARCGPIGVQGFLLGKPVEASLAAAEAQAAAARARQALENAAFAPRRDAGESLVLFGSSGRRQEGVLRAEGPGMNREARPVRVRDERGGRAQAPVRTARNDEGLVGSDRLRVAGDFLESRRRDQVGVAARIAGGDEIVRSAALLDQLHPLELRHAGERAQVSHLEGLQPHGGLAPLVAVARQGRKERRLHREPAGGEMARELGLGMGGDALGWSSPELPRTRRARRFDAAHQHENLLQRRDLELSVEARVAGPQLRN